MVQFRNFSQNGNILESDVIVKEKGNFVRFHAMYDMKTERMGYAGDISSFVYNQGLKGFIHASVNIKYSNKKYGKDFDVVWG